MWSPMYIHRVIHRVDMKLNENEISLLVGSGEYDTVKLVVRHAERPLFKGLRVPLGVSITEDGKKGAERLGILLRQQGLHLDGCTSSPVRRCIQTTECIAAGNQFQGSLDTTPSLGGSGLFTDDLEALDRTLDTCTIEEIIEGQLGGNKVPGMRDLEAGLRIFMGRVLSERSKDFEVFVSHDLFVCPAVHYLTETAYSSAGNTDFLDGFFISVRGDRTRVLWDSRWYDVTDRLGSLFGKEA
jgi:hypothetical protein